MHSFSRNNKIKHFSVATSMELPPYYQSVRLIKRKLQSFLWNHFIDHFDPNNPCSFHFICPCAKCSLLPIKYGRERAWYILFAHARNVSVHHRKIVRSTSQARRTRTRLVQSVQFCQQRVRDRECFAGSALTQNILFLPLA